MYRNGLNERSGGIGIDVEVHHVFPNTELGVERHRRIVAVVSLHENHVRAKAARFYLEPGNERSRNPLAPLVGPAEGLSSQAYTCHWGFQTTSQRCWSGSWK